MRLEQSFTVTAPVGEVWAALIDVQRVAPCLPGAEITEAGEEGIYRGTFTVKVGPTTAAYNGTLRLVELDEASRTAVMAARGTDRRGQGGATATIRSTLREDGDATIVDVITDFTITGRLARFGRGGMIEDVSRRLLRDFAACLQESIVAPAEPPPAREAVGTSSAGGPSSPAAAPSSPAPAASPPAKPLNAVRLAAGVMGDRIKRLWAALGRWLRDRRG
jgi:carbon monoxide dehydrogenase subunit G